MQWRAFWLNNSTETYKEFISDAVSLKYTLGSRDETSGVKNKFESIVSRDERKARYLVTNTHE